MKLEREQVNYIVGMLRTMGYHDLADELARRERGDVVGWVAWTKLKTGDTFMCEVTVREGEPRFYAEDVDASDTE